ncbi:hypothetical protein MJN39_24245, partial [Salmonella enterica subsp. enterica serovar Kentucky]|nr:hypothetical protein [Salmonella enterica subsp. enterica serovar Kentucky]
PVPDRDAIRELILLACKNMIMLLTQEDTVNLSKFISREQLSPQQGYQLGLFSSDGFASPLYRQALLSDFSMPTAQTQSDAQTAS